MIKVFDCPRARDFFTNYLSQDILDLNPIIAGGSAVAAFRANLFFNTDFKWNNFVRRSNIEPKRNPDVEFGDIDIWFFDNQLMYHPYEFLIKNFNDDKYLAIKNQDIIPIDDVRSLTDSFKYDFKNHVKLNITSEELQNLKNLNLKLDYVSRWSNTYTMSDKYQYRDDRNKIQFIRKSTPSIESLLDQFDFINCCVAYHDGKLFIKDGFEQSFDFFQISFNNRAFSDESNLPLKIMSAVRAFKYGKRYLLNFDEEVADFVFRVFLDSFDFLKHKNKDKPINIFAHAERNPRVYEDWENANLETLISVLHSHVDAFMKMPTFGEKYYPYFLNSGSPFIENKIKELMHPKEKPKAKLLDEDFTFSF